MTIKKWTPFDKKNHQAQRTHNKNSKQSLTPEERDQLFKEMSMGWGMMSPGCFPDGIWHLY